MKQETPCPYCGAVTHRKAIAFVASVGMSLRRHYCANGCRRYHLRHPETGAVVETPERSPRPLKSSVPSKGFEAFAAERLGVVADGLTFTARNSNGKPRVLANCLSDEDIAKLTPEDAELARDLQARLLLVNACIGVLRGKLR